MPEPTAAPVSAPVAAEPTGSGIIPSLEERSEAVFGPSEAAGEANASTTPDAPSAAASAEPDEVTKARAERRAKLDQLRAEERQRVDAQNARREHDDLRRQLAEAQARQKEYESRIDPATLNEESFFALAEKTMGNNPQKLGEWLRERMANPELVAARAATSAVDPKISALEKKLADQQAMIDGFLNQQQSAKEEAEERAAAAQFYAFTRENHAAAPLSARFLEKCGADQFYLLARSAVQRVPPGAGDQAVLDEIEENLAQLQAVYTAETAVPQRRQATPTQPNHAAAQAPTHVSNTLAQQRSSVVDEDEQWASLPFEERSARLFR